MSRFPHLPETFILREMGAMAAEGWDISLFPILRQPQAVVHEEARRWLPRVRALPLRSGPLLTANGRALREGPGPVLSLWAQTVWLHRRSPHFLLWALSLFPKAVHAARLMEREGVAYMHAHYATYPALMAWLIHQLTGIPYGVVTHAHDIFVNQTMLPAKLRDASVVVAISDFNRNFLMRTVGPWIDEKVRVIHCGIEPQRYGASPGRRDDRLEILSVGSLQPYKGQQVLVEACAHLRDQGIPFSCRIVGEGEERPRLQRLIGDHGLGDRVTLLGARTEREVSHLLAEANVYAQPSVITPSGKMEGIPVALMEALASRLPVVATNLSGIPELVRHGETGYLVPPRDGCALAAALTHIHRNRQEAIALAENGRALVAKAFNLKKNVRQLSAVISSLLLPQTDEWVPLVAGAD